jgi:quinol monooxygenase YgiN
MSLTHHHQTYEFILFTLKPGEMEAWRKLRVPFKATMRRFPGFRHSEVYQNIDDPLELLDQEIWDSLEDALRADRAIQEEEYFKIILSPLQAVSCLENTFLLEEISREDSRESAGYVELFLYVVDPEKREAYRQARKVFFESLFQHAAGFLRVRAFESWQETDTHFNLVHWTSEEAARKARHDLRVHIAFRAFHPNLRSCCLHKRYKALAA